MNLVEFSKRINISTGTISRALNGRPNVNSRTRQIVLEKAKEYGFSLNANARYLVTGRNYLIQLACPCNEHVLSDYYLVELARAVENAVAEHGYSLLLRLGLSPQSVHFQPVDGVVIVGTAQMTVDHVNELTRYRATPAVVIGEPEPLSYPSASFVYIDHVPGMRNAIKRLAELGHRRIGYVGSGLTTNHVRAAMPLLLAEAGLPWDETLMVEAGLTQQDGFRAATALLSLPQPPTAIFGRTDMLAVGVIQAARHLGLSVPGDVSVVGHDNIELAALVDPPLTTVAIDIPQIGAAAVEALLAMVNDQSDPTIQTRPAHFIERASCGPAPPVRTLVAV